jgi:hypothetical protein
MASSSSAKKVARVAARSGGGPTPAKQSNWLFPVAIVAIVLLGVGIVAFARNTYGGTSGDNSHPQAQLGQDDSTFDHWHAAFAVNVCGKELPPVPQKEPDPLGIHTHADGLIHIHPFSTRSAGKNATMKRFFDQTGMTVTNEGFKYPDSKQVYEEGKTTCGGKPAQLVLAHWKDATTAASQPPDKIFTKDFGSVRFTEDHGAYTLAFEVKGQKNIPAPSSAAQIDQLGSVDGGSTQNNAPSPTDPAATSAPVASQPTASLPTATTSKSTATTSKSTATTSKPTATTAKPTATTTACG